jgi:hypothetical protein
MSDHQNQGVECGSKKDEVYTILLTSQYVEELQEEVASRSSAGVTRPSRRAQGTRNVYSQLSGLEIVVFNDFIKDDFISEGDRQIASGSASLPDPVALETVEETLEREQNERDVREALGEYKCDGGMSVENVTAVVNIKTLKGRFIAYKFSTGWAVGVEKKCSDAGQFAVKYKSETYSKNNKHCCVHLTNLVD